MLHDDTFDFATHTNHKLKHGWRNQRVTWGWLLNQFKETHRTHETAAEFAKMKKDQQDSIKGIKPFVGGHLAGGRRLKSTVSHRQVLVLDADFAKPDTWATFTMLYGCAACTYSTHKHTADKPRLRLVIPLSREVYREEYEAIGRRIAFDLDIEFFDHTGFQPERLMFWPSTSKDAPYFFEWQDGEWLNPDKVLATYHDWKDTSEWPLSSREQGTVGTAIKKQGDPLEKPGVIGAFCRTYSITETIDKFLSDVYTPTESDLRFTFSEGSTAGGLVVYEDKYAFSHHGTDPTSGKLSNSFDLVRIHRFSDKDQNAQPETPINKLPSFIAMQEFASADKEVVKLIGQERYEAAQADFGEAEVGTTDSSSESENLDWLEDLERDKRTNLLSSRHNFAIILANDPKLKGCFAYDVFANRTIVNRDLPWRKINRYSRIFSDTDTANLRIYMSRPPYGISHNGNLQDAFVSVVYSKQVHPVKNYLENLQWDGIKRLDTMFIDYMAAEDTPYIRAVSRKALVAAVARIYEPGIKFDYILTLIGPEGRQKSTIISKLGGSWFSDSFSFKMIERGKEAFEQLQGKWLMEIGELAGMKKAEIESIKQFVAKPYDNYRPAYAESPNDFYRQCIFFGTTNDYHFLQGVNGNRRFWPIIIEVTGKTKNIAQLFTPELVAQIWAEAKTLYDVGEALHLPEELESEAREVQKRHTEFDERQGLVELYLNTYFPADWDEKAQYDKRAWVESADSQDPAKGAQKDTFCVSEIGEDLLGWQKKDINAVNTRSMHNIMKQIKGWKPVSSFRSKNHGTQRGYRRESVANGLPVDRLSSASTLN